MKRAVRALLFVFIIATGCGGGGGGSTEDSSGSTDSSADSTAGGGTADVADSSTGGGEAVVITPLPATYTGTVTLDVNHSFRSCSNSISEDVTIILQDDNTASISHQRYYFNVSIINSTCTVEFSTDTGYEGIGAYMDGEIIYTQTTHWQDTEYVYSVTGTYDANSIEMTGSLAYSDTNSAGMPITINFTLTYSLQRQ